MLDVKQLREEPGAYKERLAVRGDPELAALVDRAVELDARRRELLQEVEDLRALRNEKSREIGDRKKRGDDAEDLIRRMRDVSDRIDGLDEELADVEELLHDAMLRIPNLPDPRVPAGGEDAFRIQATWGEVDEEADGPPPHWEIAEELGILDLERGARVAGSGFPLFYGQGSRIRRALAAFMIDLHRDEHGYREIDPPFLVNRESMVGTGHLPKFEDDAYRTEPDDLFLVPTAEVPVTNLYREEILEPGTLPRAFVASTPCFRREAGSAGRDTRGLLRVHQFHKVELMRFTRPEDSEDELELLTTHAEEVLRRLGLPYRRILLAGGDLGFGNAITYDLEVWSPGVGRWLEVSSCSSYTDYQARRANIRFRPEPGAGPEFVHTLNGSGVALARTLVALLEHGYRPDGTVELPEVLHSYLGAGRLEAE